MSAYNFTYLLHSGEACYLPKRSLAREGKTYIANNTSNKDFPQQGFALFIEYLPLRQTAMACVHLGSEPCICSNNSAQKRLLFLNRTICMSLKSLGLAFVPSKGQFYWDHISFHYRSSISLASNILRCEKLLWLYLEVRNWRFPSQRTVLASTGSRSVWSLLSSGNPTHGNRFSSFSAKSQTSWNSIIVSILCAYVHVNLTFKYVHEPQKSLSMRSIHI